MRLHHLEMTPVWFLGAAVVFASFEYLAFGWRGRGARGRNPDKKAWTHAGLVVRRDGRRGGHLRGVVDRGRAVGVRAGEANRAAPGRCHGEGAAPEGRVGKRTEECAGSPYVQREEECK